MGYSTPSLTPNQQMSVFASTQENILNIEKLLQELAAPFYLNEEVYGNILVALTEAITNAVQHGNKLDANKKVTVVCKGHSDGIEFAVSDQGTGFDYSNLPDPTAPENLEKPSGRGVFLMRHLADKVDFFDNGKTVAMYFNLHTVQE